MPLAAPICRAKLRLPPAMAESPAPPAASAAIDQHIHHQQGEEIAQPQQQRALAVAGANRARNGAAATCVCGYKPEIPAASASTAAPAAADHPAYPEHRLPGGGQAAKPEAAASAAPIGTPQYIRLTAVPENAGPPPRKSARSDSATPRQPDAGHQTGKHQR